MVQETELDDLDLDKLLDDEDFLDDFDFDEPVVDSAPQVEEEMPSGDDSSGTAVSSAVESVVSPGDLTTTVDDDEPLVARHFLKKMLFPVSVVLVVLLLILQIYAARETFSPKPHISSMMKRIVVAEVITHDLAENIDKMAEVEFPQAGIITFDFYYPLYSLAGLKILGVDIQLVFPPANPLPLSNEQIEQLKKIMYDSLGQAVDCRMLEELGKYDKFFVEFLRESIASTLKQWHMPPATIRLEGLMVH
jgi:hypothetical protein